MKKNRYQVFLTTEDDDKLKAKAEELGFYGDGWRGRYFSRIANNRIAFIDDNFVNIMRALGVEMKENGD